MTISDEDVETGRRIGFLIRQKTTRPVLMTDLETGQMWQFKSISHAANFIRKRNRLSPDWCQHMISKVCKGVVKEWRGYGFQFR